MSINAGPSKDELVLVRNWFGVTLRLVRGSYPYSDQWRTENQNLSASELRLLVSIIRVAWPQRTH